MIVQAGAAESRFVHLKTERVNQMERGAHIRAQPDYIAGVRRILWLLHDQMEHDNDAVNAMLPLLGPQRL
jgi:hypothetical protein